MGDSPCGSEETGHLGYSLSVEEIPAPGEEFLIYLTDQQAF